MQTANISFSASARPSGQFPGSAPCRFVLVLALRGGIQVLEVGADSATQRAWAALPSSTSDDEGPLDLPVFEPRMQRLRRALLGGPPLPVVIAGERGALRRLRDWLPRRLTTRLRASVRVPWPLDRTQALQRIRARMAGCREAAAQAVDPRPATAMVA